MNFKVSYQNKLENASVFEQISKMDIKANSINDLHQTFTTKNSNIESFHQLTKTHLAFINNSEKLELVSV